MNNNSSNKKGAKKVRFYETNVQDQIGLFKSAEYSAPSELVNNIKKGTNENTTMNIRQNYNNRVSLPKIGVLGGIAPSLIRETCLIRETEGRFDYIPFQNINAVEVNECFRFGSDSRNLKKSYNI